MGGSMLACIIICIPKYYTVAIDFNVLCTAVFCEHALVTITISIPSINL